MLVVRERFWPNVTAAEVAKAGGVTPEEMREAIKVLARPPRPKLPDPEPKPRTRPSREGPPGTKWCTRGEHFVPVEEMGKNRSRSDGLSDCCKLCWQSFWRERRAKK